MKLILRHIGVLFCFFITYNLVAQEVIYASADSIKIEQLLENKDSTTNKLMYFASQLIEMPYKAATLEQEGKEALVINMRDFDCTTLVESVFALYLTSTLTIVNFSGYISSLQKIRYRDGILNGYPSRLHYFSDWIMNNEKNNLIKEISGCISNECDILSLDYMSTHSSAYSHLKDDTENIVQISYTEKELSGTCFNYISKQQLKDGIDLSSIKDGDIIALTTNIKGLDISHVGFAYWKNDKLYLLHASSKHKKVLVDPLSLKEYVLSSSRLTGFRVLRVL